MKFKEGDVVKYITNYYGDDKYNPRWGGSQGKIAGVISIATEYGYNVDWDNVHRHSSYTDEDLELIKPMEPIDVRKLNKKLI